MATTFSSTVYICKGVPIDRDYNHTLYFANASQQLLTFYNYSKYQLSQYSYQRSEKNVIKVQILNDNLYDCNYIVFQNGAHSNKWFFGFIDRTEYISDTTSAIYYTIDVMQTWYFDYELGDCLVEREHTETDNIGEHLIDENIQVGKYVMNSIANIKELLGVNTNKMYCIVSYVPNYDPSAGFISTKRVVYDTISGYRYTWKTVTSTAQSQTVYRGRYISNFIRPYDICSFEIATYRNTFSEVEESIKSYSELLQEIEDAGGTIISIKLVPDYVYGLISYAGGTRNGYRSFNFAQPTTFRSLSNLRVYTPKNNKLYSFPFQKIVATNNAGQSAEYKFEFFVNHAAGFAFQVNNFPNIATQLAPLGYDNELINYEHKLIYNSYVDMPWNEDSFNVWWQQNKSATIIGGAVSAFLSISNVLSAMGAGWLYTPSVVPDNPFQDLGGLMSLVSTKPVYYGATQQVQKDVSNIAALVSEILTQKAIPDQIKGQTNSEEENINNERDGFTLYTYCCDYEQAKNVDDYFTMYGYKINELKVPNIKRSGASLRPHWNYVKTANCIIHSASGRGLPQDAENAIHSIYNKGITFWMNASEVGDYSLDNSPVTTP